VNDYCHSKDIAFIAADAKGLFTWTFCDFGKEFEVFDTTGEENKEVLVGDITSVIYLYHSSKREIQRLFPLSKMKNTDLKMKTPSLLEKLEEWTN
jgi:hypothetical protein